MKKYDMNQAGGTPKYIYLYKQIKADIISGEIEAGSKLPSKRSMANDLGISLITVANAYELLVTEGYVRSEERRGYFINSLLHEHLINDKINHDLAEKQDFVLSEDEDEDYLFDLKANRISTQLFPVATWNQLMRQTLNRGEILYKTVPYNGVYELRKAIADNLRETRGMIVDPAQIIVGAGTEYLYSRLLQLFGNFSIFGFEDPGYKKLSNVAKNYGNPVRFIPIDEHGLRINLLDESDVDIIHVSPANHFPTGIVMSYVRRRELLDWAYRSSKRYIIEDDYDSEFRYKGVYVPPLYTLDTRERTIYINTFSKTLIPSLRISYMILPPNLLERYKKSMSFYSCTVSSFEQYTLAQFINEGYYERHIHRLKTYYKNLRAQVLKSINNSSLSQMAEVVERNAGTHLLLRFRSSLTDDELRKLIADAGVRAVFMSDYYDNDYADDDIYLVLNYAAIEPEKVDAIIEILASVLSSADAFIPKSQQARSL